MIHADLKAQTFADLATLVSVAGEEVLDHTPLNRSGAAPMVATRLAISSSLKPFEGAVSLARQHRIWGGKPYMHQAQLCGILLCVPGKSGIVAFNSVQSWRLGDIVRIGSGLN